MLRVQKEIEYHKKLCNEDKFSQMKKMIEALLMQAQVRLAEKKKEQDLEKAELLIDHSFTDRYRKYPYGTPKKCTDCKMICPSKFVTKFTKKHIKH